MTALAYIKPYLTDVHHQCVKVQAELYPDESWTMILLVPLDALAILETGLKVFGVPVVRGDVAKPTVALVAKS